MQDRIRIHQLQMAIALKVSERTGNSSGECEMATYHTSTQGPDREALKYGMKAILGLAKARNNVAYIATHNKNNVQDGFSDTFGWTEIQRFLKKGHMRVQGVDVYLQTERKKPQCYELGPVLSPYNSLKFTLELLDDEKNTDLVYIPWMLEELEGYLQKNQDSIQIYQGEYMKVEQSNAAESSGE